MKKFYGDVCLTTPVGGAKHVRVTTNARVGEDTLLELTFRLEEIAAEHVRRVKEQEARRA